MCECWIQTWVPGVGRTRSADCTTTTDPLFLFVAFLLMHAEN